MTRCSSAYFLLGVSMAAWSGCSSDPTPQRAELVPADVARRAMEEYDANRDGKIDAQEIKKSPALAAALKTMDANSDGTLTEDEVAARAKLWLESGARINVPVRVFLDDQPLQGATVALEPEKCMGPAYQASSATTDQSGQCFPSTNDPNFSGLYPGLYCIRITHSTAKIPAKYNTQTELGVELTDKPSGWRWLTNLRLSSR